MSTFNSGLEDVRIGVRLKISALWITLLFLYAYGDIFGFFRSDVIKEVMAGEVSGIKITQVFLLAVSVYIAIASVMVFLSLVLRPGVNRLGQHHLARPVHHLHRRLSDWRNLGVLRFHERRGERGFVADRVVRMDLA